MFILNQDRDMILNTQYIKQIVITDIDDNIPGEQIEAIDNQNNRYVLGAYWYKTADNKYLADKTHEYVKEIMCEIMLEASGYKKNNRGSGIYEYEKTKGEAYVMPL